MKNIKEIQPILTALYCLNQTSNKDKDISEIINYAFRSILDSNTNLLTLMCVGKTKEQILPEIKQLLKEETNYKEQNNG